MKKYYYITFQYVNNNNIGFYELDYVADENNPYNLLSIKKVAIDHIFKLRSYKLKPSQIIINYIHEFPTESDFISFFAKPVVS